MKKLLVLLNFMIVTSIFGTETKIGEVNVKVRAEVIKPTNLMFRIRPLNNENSAINDKLEFDFKNLVLGSTEQTLSGRYDLTLLDANLNYVEFKSVPTVTLIKGENEDDTTLEMGSVVEEIEPNTNTSIIYRLSTLSEREEKKRYIGDLDITASVKNSTNTGVFTQRMYSIKATIKNQNTTAIIP